MINFSKVVKAAGYATRHLSHNDYYEEGCRVEQAPIVEENERSRTVVLPGSHRWFSAQDGIWRKGGGKCVVRTGQSKTPLFIREGALVPMQTGERKS